jgi:hypothetical protein
MPVDALLGIPDMSKLLNESKYEVNFKSPFYKPGILRGRIYRYITFYSSAKGYTDRGLPYKIRKVESLISCMIIAANKSKEVIDDESKSVLRRTLSNTVRS